MRVHSGWLLSIGVVGLVGGAFGCGDSDGGDGPATPQAGTNGGTPCVVGTLYDCVGPVGCSGKRLCRNGFLSECMCNGNNRPGNMNPGPEDDGGSVPDAMSLPDGQVVTRDGATPGSEDCDNGRDDDGDGDPDCADSDCAARACVQEAPDGWDGPVLLREGEHPADCDGNYPDPVLSGGTAVVGGAATCSSCSCGGASSACATFLNFGSGATTDCSGVTCSASISSACAELASPCLANLTTGYLEPQLPVAPGNCAPSAQTPDVQAASWSAQMLGCAPAREFAPAGCDRGELCAPSASEDDGALCVYHDGDLPCPAGAYRDRRTYFTEWNDTRGCSECACAHDCSYSWRTYAAGDTACATPLVTLTSPDQCAAVTRSTGRSGSASKSPAAASARRAAERPREV